MLDIDPSSLRRKQMGTVSVTLSTLRSFPAANRSRKERALERYDLACLFYDDRKPSNTRG